MESSRNSAFTEPQKCHTLKRIAPPHVHTVAYLTGGMKLLYDRCLEKNQYLPEYGMFTNSVGHFSPEVGMPPLGLRYHYTETIGRGQSSMFVKAKDLFTQDWVAIKILHSTYFELGAQETDLIRRINLADPYNASSTLQMKNVFSHDDHFCMVFEYLNPQPLHKYFKQLPPEELLGQIRKVAVRLMTSLGFLQQENVIHADLKPENILLARDNDASSLKVVDFGNAVHCVHDELSLYYEDFELQTLLYRAPEVMFGCPFSTEIDMWSVGCILAELYLGEPLFFGLTKTEVMKKMVELLGPFPCQTFQRGKFFSEFQSLCTAKRQFDATLQLKQRLGERADYLFASFLSGLLKYNPDDRFSPAQAAMHPFLASEVPCRYLLPRSTLGFEKYSSVLLNLKDYRHSPGMAESIKRQHLSSHDILRSGTGSMESDIGKKIAQVGPLKHDNVFQIKAETSDGDGIALSRADNEQVSRSLNNEDPESLHSEQILERNSRDSVQFSQGRNRNVLTLDFSGNDSTNRTSLVNQQPNNPTVLGHSLDAMRSVNEALTSEITRIGQEENSQSSLFSESSESSDNECESAQGLSTDRRLTENLSDKMVATNNRIGEMKYQRNGNLSCAGQSVANNSQESNSLRQRSYDNFIRNASNSQSADHSTSEDEDDISDNYVPPKSRKEISKTGIGFEELSQISNQKKAKCNRNLVKKQHSHVKSQTISKQEVKNKQSRVKSHTLSKQDVLLLTQSDGQRETELNTQSSVISRTKQKPDESFRTVQSQCRTDSNIGNTFSDRQMPKNDMTRLKDVSRSTNVDEISSEQDGCVERKTKFFSGPRRTMLKSDANRKQLFRCVSKNGSKTFVKTSVTNEKPKNIVPSRLKTEVVGDFDEVNHKKESAEITTSNAGDDPYAFDEDSPLKRRARRSLDFITSTKPSNQHIANSPVKHDCDENVRKRTVKSKNSPAPVKSKKAKMIDSSFMQRNFLQKSPKLLQSSPANLELSSPQRNNISSFKKVAEKVKIETCKLSPEVVKESPKRTPSRKAALLAREKVQTQTPDFLSSLYKKHNLLQASLRGSAQTSKHEGTPRQKRQRLQKPSPTPYGRGEDEDNELSDEEELMTISPYTQAESSMKYAGNTPGQGRSRKKDKRDYQYSESESDTEDDVLLLDF